MTQDKSTAIVPSKAPQLDPLDLYHADILERVVVGGDLSGLTSEQRYDYYRMRCEAAGLDPRTQPFAYIVLQRKLTLYATKTATEQLCERRNISTKITERVMLEGEIWSVTCRASLTNGRFTDSTGAVNLANQKGDDRANAYMKAETKAKRRAVLALCGLGMLDESETDTLPDGAYVPTRDEIENARDMMPNYLANMPSTQVEEDDEVVDTPALATPEQLEKYSDVRDVAIRGGYRTPSGSKPKELEEGTTEADCLARTLALEKKIKELEAAEQSENLNAQMQDAVAKDGEQFPETISPPDEGAS